MKLNWIEGATTVKDFVKTISTLITTETGWSLVYPQKISDIKEKAIISAKPFVQDETPEEKEFYLMIERPVIGEIKNEQDDTVEQEYSLTYVLLSIGDKLNTSKDDFEEGNCSTKARYAWYRDIKNIEGIYFGDWLPIRYQLNIDIKTLNLIVQGEPSVDVRPYKNYLLNWAYIGALEGYEGGDRDVSGNWCLAVGSDIPPNRSNKFGINTGTGVLDITVAYSRAGAPYQAHKPKFKADNPYDDKYFIGPSEWTHKYHFDEITVVHKYDRERGKLRNVLIGDRSAIYHNDELTWKKDTPEQEVYKAFQVNAPFWIAEDSANPLYGIILKKNQK